MPKDPGAATLVELIHRISSGVALVLVITLLVWLVARGVSHRPVQVS